MRKLTDIRLALGQILADSRLPRTMCARIMARYEVTREDVWDALDVAGDVVAEARNAESRQMEPRRPERVAAPRPPEPTDELDVALAENS